MEKNSKRILENGTTLYTGRIPDRNYISGSIQIRAGSVFEPSNKKGLAHFIEHMTFQGNKNYSSYEAIESRATDLGIYPDASTNYCYLIYPFHVSKINLSPTLNFLADIIFNPLFREKDLVDEKEVIANEYRREFDQIQRQREIAFNKVFFKNTPFEDWVIGKPEDIQSIGINDLQEYHAKYFTSGNVSVALSGDLDNHLIKKAEESILKFKFGEKSEDYHIKLNPLNQDETTIFNIPRIMQGYGSIAFRTPTLDNPAYPSLILAQNLIASGRLSLARKIRKELKLVYSVTPVLHCEDKFGYLNILFDCAPDKVQTTIQETMKVLQNFKPTEEEIQQTKNTFVQHNLRAQDSPFVLFERFINEDKFNFSYNDLERRVISQTLSQVTDAFSRYLLEQPKQVTLLAPSF